MKKLIGVLCIALLLSSCSLGTIRTDKVEGAGTIYFSSAWSYDLNMVKKQFPNATLITTYNKGWLVYVPD